MPSGSVQVAPVGQTLVHGGFAALLAGDRHVEVALLRDLLGVVVGVGVREVDALLLLHLRARGSSASAGRATGCSPRRRRRRSAGSRCSARCRARRRTRTPGSGRRVGRPSPPCRSFAAYSRSISRERLAQAARFGTSRRRLRAARRQQRSRRRPRGGRRRNCRRAAGARARALRLVRHGQVAHGSFPGGCGRSGAGFGCERLEARLVRVVAVRAQQVALVAVPLAGAPAVHAGAPVA